jgi:beta-lactam-binding protein with PASTA domain
MTKEEAEAYMNKKSVKFLNVKRVSAANAEGDVLACKTSISITKNVFRVRTVVENDTCKIVLPILD